jgi:hypothetical protein
MAVQDPTTNYAWALPDVNGDSGAWGGMLRTIIGDDAVGLDAVVKAISIVANAALPKAGGAMTGRVDVKTEAYTLVNKGSMSGAVTLDLAAGNYFYGTVAGNITSVTLTNVPAGGVFFVLELTNGGAFTVTFGSAYKWPSGAQPSLVASGVDVLTFTTRDAGTTIRGSRAMADSR